MSEPSRLIFFFLKPLHQAGLAASLSIVLSLLDSLLPHNDVFFGVNTSPWIISTAMILLYILINTIVALRIVNVIPYWGISIICYLGLLAFSYGWSYLLSGRHIDDVGSFRWLWFVLTLVYLVFFAIARSMKKIVDFAMKQDKKLRGEE